MMLRLTTGAAVACFALTSASLARGHDLRLCPIELERPEGNLVATYDINEAGVVSGSAGSSLITIGQHAVVWVGVDVTNIDPVFDISHATVINDVGATAGLGAFCPRRDGACVSMIARALPGGQFESVGTLGGNGGEVEDINVRGDFVGWWYNEDQRSRAFVYTAADGLVDLGTLGGFASAARAINDAGLVVGSSYTSDLENHACAWLDGAPNDLGTLGGAHSQALDVNNDGVVVGWSTTDGGDARAVRVLPGGSMQDIQTLASARTSRATVINDAGMIGGFWSDGTDDYLFFYTEATGMVDLGARVAGFSALQGPLDINADGTMVGVGVTIEAGYTAIPWFAGPAHGARLVTDMLGAADVEIQSVQAINGSGRIAAVGRRVGSGEPVPLVLEPAPRADLDADCAVGLADLIVLLGAWGPCPVESPCHADLDESGTVNLADLLVLLGAWG